jgi:hypothetical protein
MVLPESTEFINRRNPRLFGLQTAPIFQEEFLDYFTEQNGYQPFRFFSFLSHGYINIFYKEESYFIYIIEQDKVRFLDITGFIYAQMELIQLLLL